MIRPGGYFRARPVRPARVDGMSARPQRFIRSASVLLDATGYGYCSITCPSGVRWRVTTSSVSTGALVVPDIVQPLCTLYLDSAPNAGKFLDSTYLGDRASSDTVYDLEGGETVTAEWSGGALPDHAGVVATLAIRGEQTQVL